MIKKVTKIFVILVIMLLAANSLYADGKQPPPPSQKKGSFTKKNFSNKNAWSTKGKATSVPGAPDPTGANGGYNAPIPFSSGMAILAFGSLLYFIKRTRDEKNEIEAQKDIENI